MLFFLFFPLERFPKARLDVAWEVVDGISNGTFMAVSFRIDEWVALDGISNGTPIVRACPP